MDPNDILAALAGTGGGIVVIGAGAWAWVRSRRRRGQGGDQDAEGRQDSQGAGRADRTGGSTATAQKPRTDRPAAPTWGDTLSEPASPSAPATPTAGSASARAAHPSNPVIPGTEPGRTATPDSASTSASPSAPADGPEAAETTESTEATESAQASGTTEAPAELPETDAQAPADAQSAETAPPLETPEPAGSRMERLRDRLSRSGSLGRGLLGLLTSGTIDESTWDEIEETLLLADLGPDATDELMENLRRRIQVISTDDPAQIREALRAELLALVDPSLDRRLAATRREAPDGTEVPSVALMVGVNGTGKTTTVGKLARVLVAEDRSVVLGAADTFRAAAADQLATWGSRVGVDTVRSDRDGADPASVAFDAVAQGIAQQADVVIIDTAGRLQNKKGLMDELGKVRRVAEKALHGDGVAEVLLVLDATTGQNGMQQAKVFSEVVDVTGIVLTKLDGTAKGGIVVNVQRALGVPVKMVGLGEGMDDLAPFDPHGFVDALLEA
ncbi:signal recognition particle-docking protein FtsY [Brachybacterium halotolerans subsp. kimchii]|uniref:signal recognition particle-docking protein FtsY n=1 Tax=Brachybacterium halotolerans TaxID=2795215 RepID=UPI001E318C79|nr:signal recognition particle-docking protein FtsY [Brachybacterium halotolerans]UEJ83753.1 signal recognition particle-docking protein FtsY [Brachybacterium halotolerans subsp. kimchii]